MFANVGLFPQIFFYGQNFIKNLHPWNFTFYNPQDATVCVCLSLVLSRLSLSLSSFSPSFLSLLSLSFIPLFLSSFRLFLSLSPPSLSPSNLTLSLSHLPLSCTSFVISLSFSHFSLDPPLSLPHLEFYVPQFPRHRFLLSVLLPPQRENACPSVV